MNIFEAISNLKIVRNYQEKDVDEKLIGLILDSATHVLSIGNLQEWNFIVVEDEEIKKRLAQSALKIEHVYKAPIDIVVCADLERVELKYGTRGEVVYSVEDAAQASALIILAANALGLGADLVRTFDEEEVKMILNLPDHVRPISIIPLGYPAENGTVADRIPFENLTHFNRYGNKIQIDFRDFEKLLKRELEKVRKKK